jgi:hypothetical protein
MGLLKNVVGNVQGGVEDEEMVENDDMGLNRKRGPINHNIGNPSLIKGNFKSGALVLGR